MYRAALVLLISMSGAAFADIQGFYESGRSGYEFALRTAKTLGLNTDIAESNVLNLCLSDYACALSTAWELEELPENAPEDIERLECLINRQYWWYTDC